MQACVSKTCRIRFGPTDNCLPLLLLYTLSPLFRHFVAHVTAHIAFYRLSGECVMNLCGAEVATFAVPFKAPL